MTKFWTMWDQVDLDAEDFPDANYVNMSAIEVVGDEIFWDTESALRASGRATAFRMASLSTRKATYDHSGAGPSNHQHAGHVAGGH